MALQQDYLIPNTTINISSAYYRITRVTQHELTNIIIHLVVYKDISDRNDNLIIPGSSIQYNIESSNNDFDEYFSDSSLKKLNKNLLFNSYQYLKTLDEFSQAVDI